MPCILPFFPRPSAGACLETLFSSAFLIGSSLSAGWVDSASVAVRGHCKLTRDCSSPCLGGTPVCDSCLLAFVRD